MPVREGGWKTVSLFNRFEPLSKGISPHHNNYKWFLKFFLSCLLLYLKPDPNKPCWFSYSLSFWFLPFYRLFPLSPLSPSISCFMTSQPYILFTLQIFPFNDDWWGSLVANNPLPSSNILSFSVFLSRRHLFF